MSKDVFKAFTTYAAIKNPGQAYIVWENALIDYMKNNPVEKFRLIIQEIALKLPTKRDELQMRLIEPQIKGILQRFKEVDKESVPQLRENLVKLINKGLDIKTPSNEFMVLLVEAAENI